MEAERAACCRLQDRPGSGPIKYEITVNGKRHAVAVKPA